MPPSRPRLSGIRPQQQQLGRCAPTQPSRPATLAPARQAARPQTRAAIAAMEDPLAGHPFLQSVKVLASGPASSVVLARNRTTGAFVAVKLVPRGFDAARARYLLRELLIHQELSLARHPHIVELLDVFLAQRHLAVVMEYVDGENVQVGRGCGGECAGNEWSYAMHTCARCPCRDMAWSCPAPRFAGPAGGWGGARSGGWAGRALPGLMRRQGKGD